MTDGKGDIDAFRCMAGDIAFDGDLWDVDSFINFQMEDSTHSSISGIKFPTLDELLNGSFDKVFMSITNI